MNFTNTVRDIKIPDRRRSFFVAPDLFMELVWLSELAIIIASGYLSYIARFWIIGGPDDVRPFMPPPNYFWLALAEAFLATHFLNFSGFYERSALALRKLNLKDFFTALLSSFAILLIALFATKTSDMFSRGWIAIWLVLATLSLWAARGLIRALLMRSAAQGGFIRRKAVVFGAGDLGQKFLDRLNRHADPTIELVGWFDDRRGSRIVKELHGHRVTGPFDKLLAFIESNNIDQVIIALPGSAKQRILSLVQQLRIMPVTVSLAPDAAHLELEHYNVEHVSGLPILVLAHKPVSHWGAVVKRAEDIVLASLGIVLAGPLMGLIALAIRLESRGPVLFRQPRFGFNSRSFSVYKFRTMYWEHCDREARQLVRVGDPRVTRIGRFLRRTSLDELPQLFNVLKGEMSIVGPRPHAMSAGVSGQPYTDIISNYAARHRVRPGITGWAQVNGWRGETDTAEKIQKRIDFDLEYIEKWSLWFDLRIIFRTLHVVWNDQNAY